MPKEKTKTIEEVAGELAFSAPWQYDASTGEYDDPDGFPVGFGTSKDESQYTRETLQSICWEKAHKNPQISTSIKGIVGRLAGNGFGVSCDVEDIQEEISQESLDFRNRLYNFWPKYVARAYIEGELFLCLTCHDDGFVEIDFIDPATITSSGEDSGIIYHPRKPGMPLIYSVKNDDGSIDEQIPSIFIARHPELLNVAKEQIGFAEDKLSNSRKAGAKYREIGGFYRFVVSWDKTYITKRNTGHVRTVLQWINMYEDLKKYEMDHKKSAGAYVWVVQIEDTKTWVKWLTLSDEDRRKTGIGAKKTPGGTMVLGPGMSIKAVNPTLPNISDADTDILHMVTSGLNEPEDVATGNTRGSTFASVKASRGPMSDRISDEVAYFERFLRYDFWGSIFFLKSKIAGFPEFFKKKEAVDFDKNQKPVFRYVKRRPEDLIEVTFPTSEVTDMESRARALLGVKHGSLYDTAGIPNSEIVKKLGFGNYRKLRLDHATEDEKYPKLIPTVDAESYQETEADEGQQQ